MRKGQKKRTAGQVRKAIKRAHGMLFVAAKGLGVCVNTLKAYLKEWPDLEELRQDLLGETIDLAENKLRAAVNRGNLTAIIFTLKTLGKDRGFTEKVEVSQAQGPAAKIYLGDDGFDPDRV